MGQIWASETTSASNIRLRGEKADLGQFAPSHCKSGGAQARGPGGFTNQSRRWDFGLTIDRGCLLWFEGILVVAVVGVAKLTACCGCCVRGPGPVRPNESARRPIDSAGATSNVGG